MKKKHIVWVVGILALIGLIWLTSSANRSGETNRTAREIALTCTTDMATEYHIHPNLEIYINGERQPIPANVGITPTCMNSLHTHTPDGIIHVEAPEKRDFILGDFFAVWQRPFSSEQLFDLTTGETHRIRVTVNGTEVDTYENTVLRDLDTIAIYYEPISQ